MKKTNRTNRIVMGILGALVVCLSVPQFCGCATFSRFVPAPGRTLAPWVKKVYVPMFKNNTGYYGMQVNLTQAVVDEFLTDGRLKVENNNRADVRVEGTILSFESKPDSASSDNIPIVTRYTMTCLVKLYDPYATDRLVPLARYTVTANTRYISDTRRLIAKLETDAKQDLYEQMAYNIVQSVIYGRPDTPTAQERQALEDFRAKNNPAAYEPNMNSPKMPRYVPLEDR